MTVGKSVRAFQADLHKISRDLEIDLSVVVRKVVFDLHRAVTDISPVDTGRFRASWGIAEFQIPDEPGAAPNPAGVPIEAEQQTRINVDFREAFSIFYIYNNLSYAQPLEDGHSRQAPNGVIDLALATVEADVDSALDDVLR